MRHLFVILAAAASLMALATAAAAAARIEPLRPQRGAPQTCTADRIWCASSAGGSATIVHRDGRGARTIAVLPLPSNEDERFESAIWPQIVRIVLPGRREFALIGVVRTQHEMYSGGGGSVATLTLFEVGADASNRSRAVFEAPLESSFLIRACFTPEDQRRRRDACHDEYRYQATLIAPPQGPNEARLLYNGRADSFPGRRNRFSDSNDEGALRRSDLVRAIEPRCTFERQLVRDATTGSFRWSAGLPDCGDYWELQ